MPEAWIEQWDKNISSMYSIMENVRDLRDPVTFNSCLGSVLQRKTINHSQLLSHTPFAHYDSLNPEVKTTLNLWLNDYINLKGMMLKLSEPKSIDITRKKVLENIADQTRLIGENYGYPRLVWSVLGTELMSDLGTVRQTEAEKENDRGDEFIQARMYAASLRHLDRSINLSPSYCLPRVNKGIAHKNMDQLQQASECYAQALAIDPKYKKAWNNLAVVHELTGNKSEAINCFQQTLNIDPTNEFAARRILALY